MASLSSLCTQTASLILLSASSSSPTDLTPIGAGALQLLSKLSRTAASLPPPSAPTILGASIARSSDLIRLATQKLHAYPFRDVPICWRRLHTDASLLKAVFQILQLLNTNPSPDSNHDFSVDSLTHGNESDDAEVVKTLDMALIMSGAPGPGRRDAIEQLLSALQERFSYENAGDDNEAPLTKRRKLNHAEDAGVVVPDEVQIQFAVPRVHAPSVLEFQRHLDGVNTPLVLTGALDQWPALGMRSWRSPTYLLSRTNGGKRLVPVEVGRSYVDAGWGQRIVTFREFLDTYILASVSSPDKNLDADVDADTAIGREEDGSNDKDESTGYLAQHDLFSQIPSLRSDILIPDYCYTNPPPPPPNVKYPPAPLEEPLINAWFGPRGTISPLHTDAYHNVLCQVVGSKYVRLYAPEETENVYPRGVEEGGIDMSNTSRVDVERDEKEDGGWGGKGEDGREGEGGGDGDTNSEQRGEFPRFRHAKYVETVLREGEALFVPAGWWHYVRSLEVSFSVSFWWN